MDSLFSLGIKKSKYFWNGRAVIEVPGEYVEGSWRECLARASGEKADEFRMRCWYPSRMVGEGVVLRTGGRNSYPDGL